MIIGISGCARSGKDLFFNLLRNNLNQKFNLNRFAFADELKNDLSSLLKQNFNIDVTNPTPEQKELIRPLLVCYGTDVARKINQNYWIEKIESKIIDNLKIKNNIAVLTDVRYINEQLFIKNNFKKSINIHIEREGFKPINKEEKNNNPILKENSDYQIVWSDYNKDILKHESIIDEFIKYLILKINE